MKTISRMGVAIIMAAGLLGTIGQNEAYASESQVVFMVPVRMSGLTTMRLQVFRVGTPVPVQCVIKRREIRDRRVPVITTVIIGQGSASVRVPAGDKTQIVRVVVRRSSPSHQFIKGDSYVCTLNLPRLPMGASTINRLLFSSSVRVVRGTL